MFKAGKMKKILVVSPTPSHPQNAGNRSRIFQILKYLKLKQCEIHFLCDDREAFSNHINKKIDRTGMMNDWDKVIIQPVEFS